MKRKVLLILFIAAVLTLTAIPKKVLYNRILKERELQVEVLRTSCNEQKVVSLHRTTADSLYRQVKVLKEKKKDDDLRKLLEKLFILYRVALAKHDFENSEQRIVNQTQSLSIAKEQLQYAMQRLQYLRKEIANEKK